ncbi:hypothetical protein F0562_026996 [Nyssa sinensis]|uniref:Uncharacterized protein n=1 Tax=Nyssa sinensis TaxID=561372 RepID=A0A5J5B6D6_9ASTE|nr:hypothetical protein F0562_026996 [Nyssa sinensis]
MRSSVFVSLCDKRDLVVCPKPRRLDVLNTAINDPIRPLRWYVSYQTELGDSKAAADLFGHHCCQGLEPLPLIFQDLADKGLLKKGHKALILGSSFGDLMDNLQFFEPDLNHQSSITDDAFDFVFTSSFECTKFIDRVIKIGGIVVMQLSNNPSNSLEDRAGSVGTQASRPGGSIPP